MENYSCVSEGGKEGDREMEGLFTQKENSRAPGANKGDVGVDKGRHLREESKQHAFYSFFLPA